MAEPLTPEFRADLSARIRAGVEARVLSQGSRSGKHIELFDWQVGCIEAMPSHRHIAVTMPRGNGKSTFFGAMAAEVMEPGGALNWKRSSVDFAAASLKQARIIFDHTLLFLGDRVDEERMGDEWEGGQEGQAADLFGARAEKAPSGQNYRKRRWRASKTDQQIGLDDQVLATKMLGLGKNYKMAQGRAPTLALADEPREWEGEGGGRRMFNALKGGLGKQHPLSCMVSLGVRPADPAHWFNELLEGALPRTHVIAYGAHEDDDPFDEAVWRDANPAYDHVPELRRIIQEDAEAALKGGDALRYFRVFRLNTGGQELRGAAALLPLEEYEAMERDPEKMPPRKGPCFLGVDVGGSAAMTAAAAYWPETGRMEVWVAFPEVPELKERDRRDGAGGRYLELHKRGQLWLMGHRATDNAGFIARVVRELRKDGVRIEAVGCDRYKQPSVYEGLHHAKWHGDLVTRGVGRGPDGHQDVLYFQREAREGRMRVAKGSALKPAVANSKVVYDSNDNPSLDKAKRRGRNDAAQAAIIAAGMGRRWLMPEQEEGLVSYWRRWMDRDAA